MGTYGNYRLVRRGYTLAANILVGSYSDHAHEAAVLRDREQALAAVLVPLAPYYDGWFAQLADGAHAFRGWLGALDRTREHSEASDYQDRIAAPRPEVIRTHPNVPEIATVDLSRLEIHLHARPRATAIARGRALIGLELARVTLGDGPGWAVAPPAQVHVVGRLEAVVRGDSHTGQARLVARLVREVAGHADELHRIADDPGRPPEVRILAGLVVAALRGELWREPAGLVARTRVDRRTVWTWILACGPAEDERARAQALAATIPIKAGAEDFARDFLGA
jgi:hypothetical protein